VARRWTPAQEEKFAKILAEMSKEAKPFADMSPEAVAARKRLPFAERLATYFPHWIRCGDAEFHTEADNRRNRGGMPTVDCWFRGSGKTTRYVILGTVLDIVDRRFTSIVLGGKTEDAAAEKANIIRNELRFNRRLKADYGEDIAPVLGNDEETDWTACGSRVTCFGTGQSVRGALSSSGFRPQCFRGDDLDDLRVNRSRQQQDKLWDWLWGDVYPALDDPAGESVFHVVCNMYGRNCLANRARQRAAETDDTGRALCEFHRYVALGEDGETTWPQRYSTEAIRRAMAIVGPARARTEYQCLVADEEAPFLPDWFKAYDSRALTPEQIGAMRKVAYLDPSATAKETSDFKAWITLGVVPGDPHVYCLDAWIRRSSPEDVIRYMWQLQDRYPGVRFAAEKNGFQILYWNLANLLCERANRAMPYITAVQSTTNKIDRILENQGEISQGLCLFDTRQGDQQRLLDQFCDLPNGDHDDGPDAWDGARRILGRTVRQADAAAAEATPREPGQPVVYGVANDGDEPWMHVDNPAIWSDVD